MWRKRCNAGYISLALINPVLVVVLLVVVVVVLIRIVFKQQDVNVIFYFLFYALITERKM